MGKQHELSFGTVGRVIHPSLVQLGPFTTIQRLQPDELPGVESFDTPLDRTMP